MKGIHHLLFFTFIWGCIIGLMYWLRGGCNWWAMAALWFSYIVTNPDIDILIQKIFKKIFHRWFLTHSVLFPIGLYWLIHDYIDMLKANEFGLILFIPVIIHLIADFRVGHLLNKNPHDTAGTWQISTYPFKLNKIKGKRTYRLGPKGSVWFMAINVIIVGIYIVWVYNIFGWF